VDNCVRTASGRIKTQLSRTRTFQVYRVIRSLPLPVLTLSNTSDTNFPTGSSGLDYSMLPSFTALPKIRKRLHLIHTGL